MEAKLTPEDVYWCAMLANLEYLTSGITANFDMYMKNESNAKASVDTGFRTVLCGSINDFGGTVEEIEQEYLHFNEYNPLISYQLGFHAEYTTKREILEDMAALGKKYQFRFILIILRRSMKWRGVWSVMERHRLPFWIRLECLIMAVVDSIVSI